MHNIVNHSEARLLFAGDQVWENLNEMVIKSAKEDLDAYYSGNTQYYEDEQNLLLNQLEQLNDSDLSLIHI